ncbi:hypothetical protein [Halomarina ordinaria]|uniref:Phosphatidate cytidylyltransferase n=1 Tax=Halomarina ordinaria TaxID=3033939 RepID=A0ABD5UAQ5_9EURY|nr:hypothetical protein [Halomarina sp. PSRA2]
MEGPGSPSSTLLALGFGTVVAAIGVVVFEGRHRAWWALVCLSLLAALASVVDLVSVPPTLLLGAFVVAVLTYSLVTLSRPPR